MQITRITRANLDIFKALRLDALKTDPQAFATTHDDWAALDDDGWMARVEDGVVLAAFDDDGREVGLMGYVPMTLSKMAHRAMIVMVWVRPRARGRKVAGRLLDRLEQIARDNGIRQLELGVTAENPGAIAFYSRRGYQRIGCIPGGFCHDGREIDEVLMARRLDRETP